VSEIGKHLENEKIPFAVVTRGYRSTSEHQGAKVQPHHGVNDVGDEAMLFKTRFPHRDIYVGKNRQRSIKKAIRGGNKVILLDDGFQSTHIHRDIKIMLFNPQHPYYYLRNFKSLMKKENFIFFYRTLPEDTKKFRPAVCGTYDFETEQFCDTNGKTVDIGHASLLGFSALGDNLRFKNDLDPFNLVGFNGYSDHHNYSQMDIKSLNKRRIEKKADYLVCTEKDFMKLSFINLENIPLIYAQNSIKLNTDLIGHILGHAKKENYF
jgi:tetraacyldisaccharide 4'-kinase